MRALSFALLCVFLFFGPAVLHADPFPTTDQNPLLVGFGLPIPVAARLSPRGSSQLSASLNWSNTALIQQSDNEHLIADTESRDWHLAVEHALTDRVTARIDLPYRTVSGGSLDGFIENWHSLFGMPTGDRPALPRNSVHIQYQRTGTNVVDITEGNSGVGDLSVTLLYQLQSAPNAATSVWLHTKFATGTDNNFVGHDATDVSLGIAREQEISSRWRTFGQAGVTHLGTTGLFPNQQKSTMWSGMLGLDYYYSNAVTLTVQIDGHTNAFTDSSLDLLGNAWILTFGGRCQFTNRYSIQLGIGEDIKVNSSPDVNFFFNVAKKWP